MKGRSLRPLRVTKLLTPFKSQSHSSSSFERREDVGHLIRLVEDFACPVCSARSNAEFRRRVHQCVAGDSPHSILSFSLHLRLKGTANSHSDNSTNTTKKHKRDKPCSKVNRKMLNTTAPEEADNKTK